MPQPDDQVQLPPGYVLNPKVELPRGYVNLAQPNTPQASEANDESREVAASFLPMVGSGLGPGGTVAGSVIKQFLFSKHKPEDALDFTLNLGGDLLSNEVIPRATVAGIVNAPRIGAAMLRANPTVAARVYETNRAEMAAKIMKMKYPQAAITETAAQNAQDTAANMTPSQYSGNPLYSKKSVGSNLLNIPYTQTEASLEPIMPTVKKGLSDVTQVRNWKLATGEPYTVEHEALNELLQGSGPKGEEINAEEVLRQLTGKKEDVYHEALRPQTKQAFTDLMENLRDLDKNKPTTQSTIVNYAKHRIVFALPFALAGHETSVATTAALIIGSDALVSALMKNTKFANLLTQAANTTTKAPISPLLQRAILWGMRGTDLYATLPGEDKPQKIHISDEGVPQLPQ